MTDLLSRTALRKVLIDEQLSPRKSLGQHFLISRGVLSALLKAAQLSKQDFVAEVGPGLGSLTVQLAKEAGMVLAVEKDPSVVRALRALTESYSNLEVVAADILALPKSFVAEKAALWKERQEKRPISRRTKASYKVVANLPYYIAANVLRLFLESEERPNLLVVMVQREVAEKIVARPGEMSLLAVSIQLFGLPKIIQRVPPEAFYPKPKVESAILSIRTFERWPWAIDDLKRFFKLVRFCFRAKRKQLFRTLKENLPLAREEIEKLLGRTHLRPQNRPQELSLKDWEELYLVFQKYL